MALRHGNCGQAIGMTRPPTASAFTLVEMLVAIAIAAVILGVLYGTFTTSARSAEALRARSALDRNVRLLFGRFRGDVACALRRLPKDARRARGRPRPQDDEEAPPVFVGGDEGSGLLMTFLALEPSGPDREGAGGLVWIAYRFDSSAKVLLRGSVPAYPGIGGPEDWPEHAWRVVARGVANASVEFLGGDEWGGAWDPSEEDAPPLAVALSATFMREDGGQETFRTVVRIPVGGEVPEDETLEREGPA